MRQHSNRRLSRNSRPVGTTRPASIRLRFQALESRLAPASIIVNSTADNLASDGKVCLREALTSANNNADFNADVTAFRAGVYGIDDINFDVVLFAAPQIVSLASALPNISGPVNFKGTSAANVTVNRVAASSSFGLFVCAVAGIGNVSFSNMTLSGGAGTGVGAGIYAGDDNLTITNCVLANNNSGANGGAIGVGGGGGKINITNTLFNANSASLGGALYFTNTGTLTMDNCTLTANKALAANGGGGIYNDSNTATIRNSTFHANKATAGRGGAITLQAAATVTMQNCTIAENSATGTGGGIHRQAGTVNLDSTIVAKNIGAGGTDIFGKANANFCLVGVSNDGAVIVGANNKLGTNVAPLDPMLLPLVFNGGPTPTRALMGGSPCINTGSNPAGLATDQRGPGFFRVMNGLPDIGAYEDQKLIVLNNNDNGAGSLRQVIDDANKIAGPNTISFDSNFFSSPQVIYLTTGQLSITDSVDITGPATPVTIDGKHTFRILNIDGPGNLNVSLSRMTIKNGNAGSGKGGGIRIADEFVKLFDVFRVEYCTAGEGGGIALDGDGATLEMDGSVRFCKATDSMAGGGGISSLGVDGCIMKLTETLIANNEAIGDGGGIAMSDGTLELTNSTVSSNLAKLNGGGIAITGNGHGLLRNSAITSNQAETLSGGGIFASMGQINIESCIVAKNISSAAPDISNSVAGRLKWSAVGSITGYTYIDEGGNLPFGVDLKLGPLADNGGNTWTHALLPFSPCLEKGSNPLGLTTDQRGAGFPRIAGGKQDIGPFENQMIVSPAKVISIVINDGEVQRSKVREIEVYFDQIVEPEDLPSTFQLKEHTSGKSVTLNVTSTVISGSTVATITFPSAGASLEDGEYDLVVWASKCLNASGLPLDGNGDGTGGDDYMLMGDAATNKLYRLFGDNDGDGAVTGADFGEFRKTFGTPLNLNFDIDGDGQITSNDFGEFRKRFGISFLP